MSEGLPSPTLQTAMVLAAGLGKRMWPVTATIPKPLVKVGGRTLLDHALDRLDQAGTATAVINVHYLADLVEAHVRQRRRPRIVISDERGELLETGGGVKKALPLLGSEPFVLLNSDSLWIEGQQANLVRLGQAWDAGRMDILLLLAGLTASIGYEGRGDFVMDPNGRLMRRGERQVAPFVYAGVAILKPQLFADTPSGAFSLNLLFDRAIAAGRLYGLRLNGQWLHVGTPESIAAAEESLAASIR
jgi:N-acetyl-alpha-D-muramate 1-phosphate uridylyltransferase